MLHIEDISGDNEHIIALEDRVDSLEEELRLLKLNPIIVEVIPSDMVSKDEYLKLQKLYNDLWDETMPF